jgi:hypothetical protein
MRRITRNAQYVTDRTKHNHWCIECYHELNPTEPIMLDDGTDCKKSELQEFKNDALPEEGWVSCDECQSWVHQVCALFNGRTNKSTATYSCPNCYLKNVDGGNLSEPPHNKILGAIDLPQNSLSKAIENGLVKALKIAYADRAKELNLSIDEVEKAEGLAVRILSNVEKKQFVGDEMHQYYASKGCPTEYPVRSKCVALFQKINGVDTLLFAMYVYEYGHHCPAPNKRRVYLSYLDSVQYFEPKCYRTTVYHAMLIEYLRHVKQRGFHTAHIWSCPPAQGDDYIFYVKPEHQKIPREDMLRAWYHAMLEKAKSEGIVIRTSTLYDEYFGSDIARTSVHQESGAMCIPYFEGDYCPGEIENIIRKLKSQEPTVSSSIDEVMNCLGQNIKNMKDNFIVVHLRNRRFANAVEQGEDVSDWREDSGEEIVRSKRAKICGKGSDNTISGQGDTRSNEIPAGLVPAHNAPSEPDGRTADGPGIASGFKAEVNLQETAFMDMQGIPIESLDKTASLESSRDNDKLKCDAAKSHPDNDALDTTENSPVASEFEHASISSCIADTAQKFSASSQPGLVLNLGDGNEPKSEAKRTEMIAGDGSRPENVTHNGTPGLGEGHDHDLLIKVDAKDQNTADDIGKVSLERCDQPDYVSDEAGLDIPYVPDQSKVSLSSGLKAEPGFTDELRDSTDAKEAEDQTSGASTCNQDELNLTISQREECSESKEDPGSSHLGKDTEKDQKTQIKLVNDTTDLAVIVDEVKSETISTPEIVGVLPTVADQFASADEQTLIITKNEGQPQSNTNIPQSVDGTKLVQGASRLESTATDASQLIKGQEAGSETTKSDSNAGEFALSSSRTSATLSAVSAVTKHFAGMKRPTEPVADTIEFDELVESEMFDSRQQFLNYCQATHCQFDELRRAKHSTMMVLFQLHNPTAPKFLQQCGACYVDIALGIRYHCSICPDFDLCQACYEPVMTGEWAKRDACFAHDTSHKFQPIEQDATGDTRASREKQRQALQAHILLLEHAAKCEGPPMCSLQNCARLKGLLDHVHSCAIKPTKSCRICSRLLSLCAMHARLCGTRGTCPIPFCDRIRERHVRLRQQQQLMDDRRRQAQNELYHAGNA